MSWESGRETRLSEIQSHYMFQHDQKYPVKNPFGGTVYTKGAIKCSIRLSGKIMTIPSPVNTCKFIPLLQ